MRRGAAKDEGFGPIELAGAVFVFFSFLGLVWVAGRINLSHSEVEASSRTAARTLSMARDPHSLVAEVRQDVATAVGAGTDRCGSFAFSADISDAVVEVTVTCHVNIEQPLLSMAPSMRVSRTVEEVRDQYRSES